MLQLQYTPIMLFLQSARSMHAIKNGNGDCWITHTHECYNVEGGEARLIRSKERYSTPDLPGRSNPALAFTDTSVLSGR